MPLYIIVLIIYMGCLNGARASGSRSQFPICLYSGGPEERGHGSGTDPLFEQKGWCQFPGSFELDFLRKPRKVLL